MKTNQITLIDRLTNLENHFTKEIKEIKASFTNKTEKEKPAIAVDIREIITSYEAACEYKNEDLTFPFPNPKNKYQVGTNAFHEIQMIVSALCQDWVPNYKDKNQERWFPIFNTRSGFSFWYAYCGDDCSGSGTYVGGRLCFTTKELATFAGKTFLNKYAVLHGI